MKALTHVHVSLTTEHGSHSGRATAAPPTGADGPSVSFRGMQKTTLFLVPLPSQKVGGHNLAACAYEAGGVTPVMSLQ